MDLSFLYENRKKSQIMFLGSHHWKVYGLDQINPDAGDMLTAQRKKELGDLLDILQKFQPTKVMIEANVSKNEVMNARYTDFLTANLDLDHEEYAGEEYQIGFRLAKRMGHDKIYCIDNANPELTDLNFDSVMKEIQNQEWSDHARIMKICFEKVQTEMDDLVKQPLLEIYTYLNSTEGLDTNRLFYYILAEVGKGWDSVGLNLASLWYKRNLGIFTNITHMTDYSKEERIFVVYGQGHVPYLQEAVISSPFYNLRHFDELL